MPNFSSLAASFSDLTRRGGLEQVRWSTKAENTFQSLKTALSSSPVLQNPDFCLPFLVQTDTLETGLGTILSQEFDSDEHPVIYISRKFTLVDQCYAAIE